MDSTWPRSLGVGDQVRFDDRVWTVAGVAAASVRLAGPLGAVTVLPTRWLMASTDFSVLAPGPGSGSSGRAAPRVPDQAMAYAQWWAGHLEEVVFGRPPGVPDGVMPRPGYDPSVSSLEEREAAKAAELSALGVTGASARSVRRKRQRYQAAGVEGLVDRRALRLPAPGARQDLRVLEALLALANDDLDQTGRLLSAERYRRETGKLLESVYGPGTVALPSRSTFQRLVRQISMERVLDAGTLTAAEDGIRVSRPGERVYVDTVTLDLSPYLASHARQPLLLTVALDELTWSVCTVMVHPSRGRLDGLVLLARLCAPPVRLRLVPHGVAREAVGARMPLILPEYLVLDRRPLARARQFTAACGALGIRLASVRPSRKAKGERILAHFIDDFVAHLTEREMPSEGGNALVPWLQQEAEYWAETVWQHRPRPGLLPVTGAGTSPTPQAAYAACVAKEGRVHLPPRAERFTAFLPRVQRRVSEHGVHVHGYQYDSPQLDSLRSSRQHVTGGPSSTREVRFDPHDLRQVWVEAGDQQWVLAPLVVADVTPFPRTQPHSTPPPSLPASLPVSTDAGNTATPSPRRQRVAGTTFQEVHQGGSNTHWKPDLGEEERLAYHAQLSSLNTPLIRQALSASRRLVILNQRSHGARRDLLISGPPESGKTTALRVLGRRIAPVDQPGSPAQAGNIPAVYLPIRPAATVKIVLSDLTQLVSDAPSSRRHGIAQLTDIASRALTAAGTRLVLLDDLQHLLPSSRGAAEALECLRYLADRVPATSVYSVREDALREFAGPHPGRPSRLTHLRASASPYGAEWRQMVAALEGMLRLRRHQPQSLVALAPVLHQMARGWPGALADLIRSAAVEAILDGSEQITRKQLDVVAR